MWRAAAPRLALIAAIAAGAIGCTKGQTSSASSGGTQISSGAGGSTGGATGSSSGGTTQATASGTGSTSGASGGGPTGGTSGSSTGSPFADGGYVFCLLAGAADAGPNGDGGTAIWMCRPGTYFCDLSGDLGNCTQCRSDRDCANQDLPTYDPLRPRCDLDSGVDGYQDFCQECLSDSDCAGSRAGAFCDLSPTYPPNGLEPPIVALGFETCGRIQTDCRLAGGPLCLTANQICDPLNGRCEPRPASCDTDQDCVGSLAPPSGSPETGSPYLLRPYCVNGVCNPCDGGVCPKNNACGSDADCGNPTSSPAGLHCEHVADGGPECACTSSSQCSGFWPACIGLDAGNVDDAGQPIGICSCDSDAECGDGGLACLPPGPPGLPNIFGAQAGSNFCGVPCTSPDFPSCAALSGVDICDLTARVCDLCVTDEQCDSSVGSGGPFCDANLPCVSVGYCGCILDADCPAGDSCLSGGSHSTCLGICTTSFSRCTPETCGPNFCNWDGGACVNVADVLTFPSCVNDADCTGGVCFEGTCVMCDDDADCVHAGETVKTHCCPNAAGDPVCDSYFANVCVSSCGKDADCAGNRAGASCQNGECGCLITADCSAGQRCAQSRPGGAGTCVSACLEDGGCPANFWCTTRGTCEPECSDSRDCDGGFGCSGNVCQLCADAGDCAPGSFCLGDGLCHASCDAGACPAGGACDRLDQAGNGPNLCYACLSSGDCPGGQVCNTQSHTCGGCTGPTALGGPFECPPDAVCSNYWLGASGVCLQNCDRESCPGDRPICAVLPSLTPDHKYCFGCLDDSDCGDAGSWCDQSFDRTFACQPPG